jgi:peptide chain release factor subunit 1
MTDEYELRKQLKTLRSIRGSGTELITIYIPPGYPISETVGKLKEEYGQSSNIKSKSTKQNVQSAIDKIIQYLKQYRETPKNGLAIFCGNISPDAAKTDIELFAMEPPLPINQNMYRCDSAFVLEPLETVVEAKDTYAIVLMDGRDAIVAGLKGTKITIEKKIHSMAHAHVRKGGQSAARYERMSEEATNDYHKTIAQAVNDLYAKNNFKIKGLIVGGSGPAKEYYVKSGHMNYQVKILGVFDTGYTDDRVGMNELLSKTKEVLAEQESIRERTVMEKFMMEVARGKLAAYGYQKVMAVLNANKVSTLLISEDLTLFKVEYSCGKCGKEVISIETDRNRKEKHSDVEGSDKSCDGPLRFVKESDAVEELIDAAHNSGVEIFYISTENHYGDQLLQGFHGVGAILRYS